MKKLFLALLFILMGFQSAEAAGSFGKLNGSMTCGDKTIGTVGTGIYAGYTLVACENFQTPLDIMGENANNGKYLTTNYGGNNYRIPASPNNQRYRCDSLHTGWQDSNRGSPISSLSDFLVQSGSLAEKVRVLTGGESTLLDSMTNCATTIYSAPWITFTAPAIAEFYSNYPSGAPTGWHPTDWVMQTNPVNTVNGLEFDLCEGSSQYCSYNSNVHGTVGGGWTSGQFSLNGLGNYGANHWYTELLNTSGATLYYDGILEHTYSGDTTVLAQPYEWIMTAVTYNAAWNGDSGLVQSAWNAAGASGAVFSTQQVRLWLPNAVARNIMIPSQFLPTQQVAYNNSGTSINYTFPTCNTVYSNIAPDSCYLQAIGLENSDFGSDPAASASAYTQWPSGLSASGSVLSGTITGAGNHPGRLHLIMIPTKAGGSIGYTANGYIDVGPNITSSSISYSNGTGSFDLYPITSVGSLMPKTVSVSGLPSGLTFSPSTFLITGTATLGSYTITISVTNVSGQNVTNSSVTLTVGT